MKIVNEWIFVGYGLQLDIKENSIGYVIVHPRPNESLEAAVTRAKEKIMESYQEKKEGRDYQWSLCHENNEKLPGTS